MILTEGVHNTNLHNQNKRKTLSIFIDRVVDTIILLDEWAIGKAGVERQQTTDIKHAIHPPTIWTKASKCDDIMQRHRGFTKSKKKALQEGSRSRQ